MTQLRGLLWVSGGLLVALLAGLVAFTTLSRAAAPAESQAIHAKPATATFVAAAQAIAAGDVLTAAALELREVPAAVVPEGAVRTVAEVEGKVTLVDLYPGEIVLSQRLVDPTMIAGDGQTILPVQDNEVLMAIPAVDVMSRIGVLKAGDQVDLLFSLEFGSAEEAESVNGGGASRSSERVSFSLLQDVSISALVAGDVPTPESNSPRNPEALLLVVEAQDALVLKHMLDAGGKMDIVVRAQDVAQELDVVPVDEQYLINRYRIPVRP